MRSVKTLGLITGTSLAVLLLVGCPLTGKGTGTLRVLVTDKPYPYDLIESAVVTITRVDVRTGGAEGENAEGENAQGADDEAFVTVYEGNRSFDLTDLRNGRADLLAEATIDAGVYTQVRLYVGEGELVLTNGRSFPLRVPSGAQSGIKLNFTFEIEDGEETVLILDVDMSRAFRPVPAGEIEDPNTIEEFQFSPSIAMRLIEQLEAGSIVGTVTGGGEPIVGASLTAYDEDGNEVTSTASEDGGLYELGGLPTGTYRVECSATKFMDATFEDVDVTAGEQTTGVDFTLEAAAE